MKLPKTRPWRKNVDGELLVGILSRSAREDPRHADLWLPVGLEPFRTQPVTQAQRSTVAISNNIIITHMTHIYLVACDLFCRHFYFIFN